MTAAQFGGRSTHLSTGEDKTQTGARAPRVRACGARRFEPELHAPRYIITEPGVGYRFVTNRGYRRA